MRVPSALAEARERLRADDLAAVEVDDRLVGDAEAVAGDQPLDARAQLVAAARASATASSSSRRPARSSAWRFAPISSWRSRSLSVIATKPISRPTAGTANCPARRDRLVHQAPR